MSPSEPAQPTKAERKAAKKRARKPGRARRVLLLVLLVLVALRYTVLAMLPSIVDDLAAEQGLACTYERLDLSIFGMDVELAHLDLAVADGRDPFVHVEYLRADVAVLPLLFGDVIVRRVEVDGLDVEVQRDTAGRLTLLDAMADARPAREGDATHDGSSDEEDEAAGPADPDTAEPGSWEPPPLSSPIALDALRVQHLQIALHDLSVEPPLVTRLDGNLRLSDLGSSSRPLRVGLDLTAPDVLDQFSLEIEAAMPGELLGARVNVRGRGIHPRALAGYLEPAGVRPVAETIDLDLVARLDVARSTGGDPHLSASVEVSSLRVSADGRDALSSGPLVLDVARFTDAELRVSNASWSGLLARAELRPEGHLRVAGVDLVGGTTSPPPEPTPPSGPGPVLRLDALLLSALRVEVLDGSVSPPAQLVARIDTLEVHDVDLEPADTSRPIRVDARLSLPGVLSSLTLGVEATPFADAAHAHVEFAADGIAPDILRQHLLDAGIECELRAGGLGLQLDAGWTRAADGSLTADAQLADLVLREGDDALLSVGGLSVDRVDVSADGGDVRVGTIAFAGLRASAVKDASGALLVAGLRILPTPVVDATASAPTSAPGAQSAAGPAAPPGATDAAPLRLAIEALRWSDNQVAYRDETYLPAAEFAVADVGFELTDLQLDTDPGATFPLRTDLRAWLSTPGVLERLELTGALAPSERGGRLDLALRAVGLRPDAAKPVLDAAGITSELVDGRLSLDLALDFAQDGDETQLDLSVTDIVLHDGERELFGLDAVTVEALRSAPGRLDVGQVGVERPRLAASRDTAGDLHVLGLRIAALAPPPVAAATSGAGSISDGASGTPAPRRSLIASRARSRAAEDASAAAMDGALDAAPNEPAPASVTTLGALALRELTLSWSDAFVAPATDLSLVIDADVTDVVLGEAAPPLSLSLRARVPEVVDGLTLSGSVRPDAADLEARLAFVLEGLREGPLAAYMPPGLSLETEAGRLAFALDANVANAPAGGQSVRVSLHDLTFADGEHVLGAIGEISLDAPRLDGAANVLEIDAVRLLGIESDVTLGADGRTHLLGLALGESASAAGDVDFARGERVTTGDATTVADAGTVTGGDASASGVSPADMPPAAPHHPDDVSVAAPAAAADMSEMPILPDVRLGALELQLARLSVTDLSAGDATPLEVRDLRLALDEPFTLHGGEPELSSSLSLSLTGSAAPILGELALHATLVPFAADPSVHVTLDLAGLRGAGITEAFPSLAETLDGSQLEDGRFHAGLEIHLTGSRRHALDFVPASGLSAELRLHDVVFRDGPDGEVLLGLDELRVEADRIAPRRNLVHLGRVEVTRPVARVRKSVEATTVLDLRLLAPRPGSRATSASTLDGEVPPGFSQAGAVDDASSGGAVAATPGLTGATGDGFANSPDALDAAPAAAPLDLRVGELSMSGIDVRYTDTSTFPPLDLPLNDLELLVRGFGTKALELGTPVKFHLFVGFDTIDDWRSETPGQASLRPVGEFLVDGRLGLGEHPTGWTKVRLDGVSLPAFAGPARASGVELQDGMLDARVEVRFLDDATIDTRSLFVFTDLDMSEPDDGPISKWLLLPAPLDTVIFLLRDEAGSIHIPLNVALDEGSLSVAEITSVATATLGRLIGNAVASSPLRVVSGVGDVGMGIGSLLGLVDEDEAELPEEPVRIEFPAISLGVPSLQVASLDTLVERLREEDDLTVVLSHEMGRADLVEGSLRANPSASDCEQLAAGLRRRKLELLEDRAQTAARARTASLARIDDEQRNLVRRLLSLDRELGMVEMSLDQVLDLLRPGAERRAPRRTREACLSVAALRLHDVRTRLLAAAADGDADDLRLLEERVRVQRPRFTDDDEMPERGAVVIELAHRRLQ